MLTSLAPSLLVGVVRPGIAHAQQGAVVVVRDAETESLLRTFAHPCSASPGSIRPWCGSR
ncbi:hypothetical protein ACFQU2_20390 [Siccirubricoccus deserti]